MKDRVFAHLELGPPSCCSTAFRLQETGHSEDDKSSEDDKAKLELSRRRRPGLWTSP